MNWFSARTQLGGKAGWAIQDECASLLRVRRKLPLCHRIWRIMQAEFEICFVHNAQLKTN